MLLYLHTMIFNTALVTYVPKNLRETATPYSLEKVVTTLQEYESTLDELRPITERNMLPLNNKIATVSGIKLE